MSKPAVSVVDIGIGNIGSVMNMLKVLGVQANLASTSEQLENAEKIILPGVGAYDEGIRKIDGSGFRSILDKKVVNGNTPILGVCLGMQLLCNGSDEGVLPGLGYVDAYCRHLSSGADENLRVPHMGWDEVDLGDNSSPLFLTLEARNKFYFTHSYAVNCKNDDDVIGWTNYGKGFVSAFCKGNIYGVQFHPEKSHKFGKTLLNNFLEI